MIEANEVHKRVAKALSDQWNVGIDECTLEASFTKDLGADSLDVVVGVMCIEEEFGLCIMDEDAEKFYTVGDMVTYVTKELEAKP